MKTIAVIGTRGFPGIQGGVEAHSYHLYTHMQDVKVRLYRRRAYLTEQSSQTFPNIEYIDLPSTRVKGFEAVWHTLLSVLHIAFHRPDVVHIHNIGPGMFAPLVRLMGLPVVLTYHSPNYEHSKWSAPARWLLRQCERLSLRYSNRVIFVNKHQMEKCGALDKSVFIPNGIDPVTRSESTSFLEKHDITPGQYLLAVGRLTPEKGLEYLVEAANRLPQVTQVVIAGASVRPAVGQRGLPDGIARGDGLWVAHPVQRHPRHPSSGIARAELFRRKRRRCPVLLHHPTARNPSRDSTLRP